MSTGSASDHLAQQLLVEGGMRCIVQITRTRYVHVVSGDQIGIATAHEGCLHLELALSDLLQPFLLAQPTKSLDAHIEHVVVQKVELEEGHGIALGQAAHVEAKRSGRYLVHEHTQIVGEVDEGEGGGHYGTVRLVTGTMVEAIGEAFVLW